MAEILSTVSIVAFVLSAVFFVVAVVVLFVLNIPSVIGDLSGRTAKKAIDKRRIMNENSGDKSYRTSETNAERGKLTSTMQHERKGGESSKKGEGKKRNAKAAARKAAAAEEMVETGLLERGTPMASHEETEVFASDSSTELLDDSMPARAEGAEKKQLTTIENIMFIHTDEVIG